MPAINFFISLFSLALSFKNTFKIDRVYDTAHFKIYYTVLDDNNIKEIADSLETGYHKITSHLQSGDLPVVNVHLYQDIAALQKVYPDFPVWAVGQATSISEIHMITPNDPKQDYQNMVRNIKHEFAHCVSIKINSNISNNPRWLWEAVALYEANFPWDPKMLDYLVKQQPPSIKDLDEFSSPKIYEVGYFIAQFIAQTYGPGALKSLIQNNGNVKDTLKMTEEEFTKQWFGFVKKKYSI